MKGARITAVVLVLAAAGWIASGHLGSNDSKSQAAVRPNEKAAKVFRVGILKTERVSHRQKLTISGRTEADKRVMITARTGGVLTDLRVKRGTVVKEGDIIAILSDEARESQVIQARAVAVQKRAEFEAKSRLIQQGNMPKLEAGNLEAQLKIAEAQLAAAEAERERGVVRAPWSGIINDVSVEVGQAAFSFSGKELAQIVSLDPMLAVVEVAERKIGGIKPGDEAEIRLVTGQTAKGKVRFVSRSASQTTRTYRVEIEIPNADGAIADGVTAEVSIRLAANEATRVPRSALVFASNGDLGLRFVNAESVVAFAPVAVVEDDQAFMWVAGIPDGASVIVEGQDFVREGQKVDAVPVAPQKTAAN
ncbi:efflux pump periplasmic linker BepF [Variibacter gotjawalensis]|uniref:Efflux pump periplasmic linker BepF n=1 Tax=Variibacter gotjawalensis TaxID=1333996 RepID=A0A0S3PP90_9BRAD|nr:efflux RND transporter periplasmic adaptor subunit [Variibacter gotjawalensis]NIK48062.1 multidrug efflux system membrane fusion protein [Variibacter gotjawalensis]RZS49938.1 multidrug efflux system membrane fusion protein [Variibacter gotjawalensis]BAT57765.1 efflux pump periplasmic linker BepF [Variibacter gotjawalensis]